MVSTPSESSGTGSSKAKSDRLKTAVESDASRSAVTVEPSTHPELSAAHESKRATILERAEVLSDRKSTQEFGGLITAPSLTEQKPQPQAQPWHHALTTDILDKQYRLYSWNDAKSLSLITTNSVLLAAIGFLFKECLSDPFSMVAILLALFLVSLSLYFSLKQVIPQGSSGKSGLTPNIRALSGIPKFETWEKYHARLLEMNEDDAFECAARQIYGMALNNDVSRKTTTRGVLLTLFGILFIVVSTVGVALSARGMHVLGPWAASSLEESQQGDPPPASVDKPTKESKTTSSDSAPAVNPSPVGIQPTPLK